jgi:hypothetical protein
VLSIVLDRAARLSDQSLSDLRSRCRVVLK